MSALILTCPTAKKSVQIRDEVDLFDNDDGGGLFYEDVGKK